MNATNDELNRPTMIHCKPADTLDSDRLLCGMKWYAMPAGHRYIIELRAELITCEACCEACRAEAARLALEASKVPTPEECAALDAISDAIELAMEIDEGLWD